ncbi:MAG: amino acid adenylation domain-containing protein [Desulfonatronovibrio sp.]
MQFKTFELTRTQQQFFEDMEQKGNRCAVFCLEGPLDEKKLAGAVQQVIGNCLPFAYKFLKVDNTLKIFVSPDHLGELRVIDVRDEEQETLFHHIESIRNRKFRLDGGSPYQFCLLRGQDLNHLVFVCHPVIMDRFSLKPLFSTLSGAYQGEILPKKLGLPQDILINEEEKSTSGPAYEEGLRFWVQLIKDSAFEWRPPRVETDLADNYFSACLTETHSSSLVALARELDLGLDELLLFSFHLFLSRMTRSESVLSAYCHRIRTGSRDQIGFNENRQIFKSVVNGQQTVSGFLRQASRLFAQARHHSDIPTGEVIQELMREDPDYKPTNILFDEDTLPYTELVLDGIRAVLLPHFSHRLETENIAVYFDIQEKVTFHVLARFAQDVSGLKTAFEHYMVMLENLPGDLNKPVSNMEVFTESLRRKALSFADGGLPGAPAEDVLSRFAAFCNDNPKAPAVRYENICLSYQDLSESAGSVAGNIYNYIEGRKEAFVGICMGRSHKMIQAILGVLTSGAAYVPLDPQMPAERLSFISSDSGLALVIADAKTRDIIAPVVECPIMVVDDLLDNPESVAHPCNFEEISSRAAYVIYTSGTTGKPKGVVIERGMLAHLIAGLEGQWERGPGSRWLQFASINFDASILEIFNPLTHGGELVITPSEVRTDPGVLFSLLKDKRITHAFLPPALLRLLPRRPLPHLQELSYGGEAGDEDTVRFWSKVVNLTNCYGPTEGTVMATINPMEGFKAANHLGRPVPGYKTYLLDSDDQLTPLGGIGEICLGGPSVARGYLGRPELTSQKFRPDPYSPGRLYKTGDLGRFLPDGQLEFLGRSDFQVKIRGFRIELGDIENIIAGQPEVSGVYVAVLEVRGSRTLMAWYVARDLEPEVLRQRLAENLPHYMVPVFLIPVPAFPLNLSGKIDRTRLPMPDLDKSAAGERPMDELEIKVRNVWAEVLKMAPQSLGLASHFFHLGGHSLLAALVCNRLSEVLNSAIRPKQLFEHPVLADFCEQVRTVPLDSDPLPSIVSTDLTRAPIQNRLIGMIHSRAMRLPEDNTYNIVLRIDFSEDINPLQLRRVFSEIMEVHPVFRACFTEEQNRLWITASDHEIPLISITDADEQKINETAENLRAEPLGIFNPPLWRAEILCTRERATLLFCVHHAIFDGWSLNLFLEELAARYEGREIRPRLSWFDYCNWACCLQESKRFAESIDYWKAKLDSVNAHTELPVDLRQKQPDANQSLNLRFEPDIVASLKAFADEQGITLSPLMFALYLVWIWRLTGQEELVCGYPYAGRDVPGSEDIFGMFVTMGFLRQNLQPRKSFRNLARAVHKQMLDDKDHLLATPYDAEIAGLENLNLIFSLQSGISLEGEVAGVSYRADELPSLTSKADITGIFYESADGAIEGRIEFDSSVIKPETASGFVETFKLLMNSAAHNPETRIIDLEYLSDQDLTRFLDQACGPLLDARESSIPERFKEIARSNPSHSALVFDSRQTTYKELDKWSDRIAAGLASRVRPGERVGLSMRKSDGVVATVLGILKLGCAYVPLDSGYPPDRVRFFVENCAVKHVAADSESTQALTSMGLENLEYIDPLAQACEPDAPLPFVAPDTLAYIIHTSGSTGLPKGVMIEHGNVVRLAQAAGPAMDMKEDAVGALIATLNFDASVLDMFVSLLNGRTLAVISEADRKDPSALHRALDESGVTHALLSPVVLQNFPRKKLSRMQVLAFGGDVLDEKTADWWSRRTSLLSLYGPTEITVMASLGRILPGTNSRIIGKPLPGYRTYLLNRFKQPVPQGAVGEICIAGSGLARGYINREEMTLERFVLDPFGDSPYALMYLTGDLGRFMPDGTIEFFGRNDAQVKIRGFRIELGEIESCLEGVPGLEQVVCAARGQGDNRYLAAYYLADQDLDEESLRAHAAKFLPDYMIPSFFLRLDKFPVSPSGKIDRKALPEVSGKVSDNPPRPGLEQDIAGIWEDVLRYRGIGRNDSFFRVGGNSLLAVRMQAEVKKRLGMEFSMSEFYGAPTIEALAAGRRVDHVQQAVQDAEAEITVDTPASPETASLSPKSVLLTGARGFLGIFLLEQLTRQADKVYCLLRCGSEAQGLESLREKALSAGLEPDFNRIRIIPGDLSAPDLGLSESHRQELESQAEAILHCGAFVHHLHNYSTMKPVNVNGTRALLDLAVTTVQKPFCFVSTITVAEAVPEAASAAEEVSAAPPGLDIGYVLTKWVGERLVQRYSRKFGLPAIIVRPGNITGSSITGFSNYDHNHFWLFTKGCLQLGAYPDMSGTVEMTPVDQLATAICALFLNPGKGLLAANLSNPRTISQTDFFEELTRCGFKASAEAPGKWQQKLSNIGQDNALAQIKDFYTGDLRAEDLPVEQSAALEALDKLGVNYRADYGSLIPLYVRYLRKEGFLA